LVEETCGDNCVESSFLKKLSNFVLNPVSENVHYSILSYCLPFELEGAIIVKPHKKAKDNYRITMFPDIVRTTTRDSVFKAAWVSNPYFISAKIFDELNYTICQFYQADSPQ